jgi:hypothetical protein
LVLLFTRSKFEKTSDWGIRTVNGSWDGMIGKLMKDEADIALSDFHMSVERLDVTDFLFTLQTTS